MDWLGGQPDWLDLDAYRSGFTAYRTSTTAVSGVVGTNLFPASFYPTTGQITSDYTYAPATNNKLTVANAGWYMVTIGVGLSAFGGNELHLLVYRNGTLVKNAYAVSASSVGEWQAFLGSCSFIVYCNAGDYLQPGYYLNAAASSVFVGEATGLYSSWSVSLLNRSLL